jgi:pyridoxamine 5'-phosphate oxidase
VGSPQSQPIANREVLTERLAALTDRYGQDSHRAPVLGWLSSGTGRGGVLARATSRLHDRIVYTLVDGVWRIGRLAPVAKGYDDESFITTDGV